MREENRAFKKKSLQFNKVLGPGDFNCPKKPSFWTLILVFARIRAVTSRTKTRLECGLRDSIIRLTDKSTGSVN